MTHNTEIPKLTAEQWHGLAVLGEAVAESECDAAVIAEAMRMEMDMVAKAAELLRFLSGPPAAGMTRGIVEATAFAQEQDLPAAARDALVTLSALHRDGTLKLLRDWSAEMISAAETIDWNKLAGETVTGEEARHAPSLPAMVRAVRDASAEADRDERNLGGFSGLLHMLRNRDVQYGMRTLMVLPVHLRRAGNELNGHGGRSGGEGRPREPAGRNGSAS